MILLTDDLRERLLAHGRDRGADHVPVVKFFNPLGAGVWLATELDAQGDALFGLADLGCRELGSFSLEEFTSIRLPFGIGIERDTLFHTELPISAWAKVARQAVSSRHCWPSNRRSRAAVTPQSSDNAICVRLRPICAGN